MKKIKRLSTILVVLLSFSVAAFAQEDMAERFDAGYAAVDNIFNIFNNYSKDRFSAEVSDELEPIRAEFLNSIDSAAARQQHAEFEFYVDKVLIADSLMTVEFNWYKKFKLYDDPDWKESEGQSEFIFIRENNDWKLRKANGDNPF